MKKADLGAAALTVLTLSAITLLADPPLANASWYPAQVSTLSTGATLRDCYHPQQYPSTSCNQITFLGPGTSLRVVCHRYGQRVTGAYGSSDLWDYVVVDRGADPKPEGFVADANIYTGKNGLVAELCR